MTAGGPRPRVPSLSAPPVPPPQSFFPPWSSAALSSIRICCVPCPAPCPLRASAPAGFPWVPCPPSALHGAVGALRGGMGAGADRAAVGRAGGRAQVLPQLTGLGLQALPPAAARPRPQGLCSHRADVQAPGQPRQAEEETAGLRGRGGGPRSDTVGRPEAGRAGDSPWAGTQRAGPEAGRDGGSPPGKAAAWSLSQLPQVWEQWNEAV